MGDVSDPADRVRIDILSLLPAVLPPTVSGLIYWIGKHLANISIPVADINDLCTTIGVTPSGAATTLTTNASKLGLAVGLVFSHPLFQRR